MPGEFSSPSGICQNLGGGDTWWRYLLAESDNINVKLNSILWSLKIPELHSKLFSFAHHHEKVHEIDEFSTFNGHLKQKQKKYFFTKMLE